MTTESPVSLRRMPSPIGRIEIVGDGRAVVGLSIESAGRLPCDHLPERPDAVVDLAVAQLEEYFDGKRREFDVPVVLAGSSFQRAVWARLSALAFGDVTSYGEIGRETGRATAGRAVGGAIGANPVPILVPCHRVLAGDGRITGYSAGEGIETKAWLLRHEGIPFSIAGVRSDSPTLDIPAA